MYVICVSVCSCVGECTRVKQSVCITLLFASCSVQQLSRGSKSSNNSTNTNGSNSRNNSTNTNRINSSNNSTNNTSSNNNNNRESLQRLYRTAEKLESTIYAHTSNKVGEAGGFGI